MTQWHAVTSSNIAALAHNPEGLYVRFANGSIYFYEGVEEPIFAEILAAPSVGQSFAALIKKQPHRYPFRRMESPVVDVEA